METFLTYVPSSGHHYPGHPESPDRLSAIYNLLGKHHLLEELVIVEPVAATPDQLHLVHSKILVNRVKSIASRGGGHLDADTYATSESYDLATLAAGSTCLLVDKILANHEANGFALVRPPGHHVEVNRVGGFCLFNNISIATRHAQEKHGLERILIIDFDVHHGNGTQDIFYEDPSVLFVSMHLFLPFFYPGTGALMEIGSGEGMRRTVNVPFGRGTGDYWYLRTVSDLIWPLANSFRPDAILISAGFDAHWIDPLAMAGVSLTGYRRLAEELVKMADTLCEGNILFVLEGGYHLQALSYGVLNVINVLLGRDEIFDPLGPKPDPEADMSDLIAELMALHLPDR